MAATVALVMMAMPTLLWASCVDEGSCALPDSVLTLDSAPVTDGSWSLLQQRAVYRDQAQSMRAHVGKEGAKASSGSWSSSQGIVRLLDFELAAVTVNNLGGQGPQKTLSDGEAAPEEIRYSGLVVGQDVDLVVTTDAGYSVNNAHRNGIIGANGQINAKSGTTVPLTFQFVDAGTYRPITMPKFYITFSDLDERHGGVEFEKLKVEGFDKFYTNDDLKLISTNKTSAQTFQSSDYGSYEDNDFLPDSPEPTQLSHAVTFLFTEKSSFKATFSIEDKVEDKEFHEGRNIVFSGISQLVFCQDPSTYLDFKNSILTENNLGGQGPTTGPAEMRYSHVATFEGSDVDLIVTADMSYGYTPSNNSNNGLHGDFGHVNMWVGPTKVSSEAYLTFTIVETGTETPVTLNAFAFVVFDFDQGLHEQQIEYVEMKPTQPGFKGGEGYSSYIVTSTTELLIEEGKNGAKKFSATKHGTEADNPLSSQMLAREIADKSAVFTFKDTASFSATFGITPSNGETGRNFMFSGQDMYLMCD